ncbi:MAG: branched-chain-amino-acid transaminase [bacterium]|jgi:branched-chain amino acid aminotransferase|nr:branched-chain-amino-acid transaminase [bacterium]
MTATQYAISINGQFFTRENAKISVFDHGFLYGDGVFEGIRIYKDKIFRGERHVARLFRCARVVAMQIGMTQEDLLNEIKKVAQHWAEINQVDLKTNDNPLYVRVVVSRGDGDMGLDPRKCPKPNIIIIIDRLKLYPQEYYDHGLTLVTTVIRRNSADALPPQVKSLNYLNNVLAKLDANRQGAAEAIFLNHQGYVAEATADNIFVVSQGRIKTPYVNDGALPGITRESVMELALELGIPMQESHVSLTDLFGADECFVTGTAARVVPVTTIDGRSIGTGQPGPVTRQLMTAFVDLTEKDGVPIYEEICA